MMMARRDGPMPREDFLRCVQAAKRERDPEAPLRFATYLDRLEAARLAARKVAIVNLTEAAALRLAWRVVRENTPATSAPAATGKTPTPDLFTEAADEPQTGPTCSANSGRVTP